MKQKRSSTTEQIRIQASENIARPEFPGRPPLELSHDAIATVAHQLWLEAGQPPGEDTRFWFEAEQQLIRKQNNSV